MLEAERAGRFGREGRGELRLVLLDRQQALHDRLPDPGELAIAQLRQLVRVAEHVAVAERAAHLAARSEEHTSELQSRPHLVCRLLLEKMKQAFKICPVVASL